MYYCWGDNSFRQLGINAGRRASPRVVRCREGASLGGQQIVQAACGERHSLLLLADGTVWSCGNNSYGQLGRKNIKKSKRPAPIQALETQVVVSVSCGKEHSLAICKTGRIYSWGSGSRGQLGIKEVKDQCSIPKNIAALSRDKIIQVSCGHYHSIALTQDGKVFSWGDNDHGQLGLGTNFPSQASPQRVNSLDGIPLAQVAAGGSHSFALSLSGTSYGWGRNKEGQLALSGKNASVEKSYKPLSIGELKRFHVTYISCGDEHTAVLTQDGKVLTFGSNNSGQLGHGLITKPRGPQIVESAELFSQIACGSHHTLAYACTSGQVLSFGCGSQRHLTNSLQQGSLEQNFNISNLISSNDFTGVRVKDIFAGANSNFVTTIQLEDASSLYATGRSLQQISQINQTLIRKWTTVETGSEEHEESKREICEIFSHPACLTACFLKKRNDNTIPNDVDLKMARNVFEELIQKDWITRMITTCLRDNTLKALPLKSPYQEALSVFLLLPECPVMHKPENWQSLVMPFAQAVCQMNDRSSEVLEKCWASMEKSSFKSLIELLKRTMGFQINFWSGSVQDHCNSKDLLGMMKKLHMVNKNAKSKVPENIFHISELYHKLNFWEDLSKWKYVKAQPQSEDEANNPVIFAHFPFIFDLPSKVKMLEINSILNRQAAIFITESHHFANLMLNQTSELATAHQLHLKVRRNHLVEDALRQLNKVVDNDLKKELLVSFTKEIGPDYGGVRKAFFHYVFEEMIHPKYEMFMYCEESSLMWFPPSPKFDKKNYFLFGILCGLSIVNGNVANLPFPLALYKKLLNQKLSLEDLQELSPKFDNLKLLLDENAKSIEDFLMYFSIHWVGKDVDLIPNGSSVLVNKTNRKDFISKYINYILNTSVEKIYKEFERGFYKVCEKEILNFFHPEELREVMTGNPEYDWKKFEENSEYHHGYCKSHPTIVMFWDAFHRLSLEQKKKFLLFLTGSDRFQARGVENSGIKFFCPDSSREEDPPKAQTCFNILYLPKYSTMKRMEEALQTAIRNNKGFVHLT
ncbi:probable E3 ubiquitin-protein ligase HERC6 isoform X1 [Sarcophilus harrisii]|uniref:probable E3 ubiquitin-protein ligase HERC6 isoform X1 n=1 Tax=Sarcophilus harrisii TaxID=9305 RepID=UPI000C7BB9A9|nr:probable E3 ubiquitin-protein ligase HERC6 isoform X1 [Sarcophilus harrisii]